MPLCTHHASVGSARPRTAAGRSVAALLQDPRETCQLGPGTRPLEPGLCASLTAVPPAPRAGHPAQSTQFRALSAEYPSKGTQLRVPSSEYPAQGTKPSCTQHRAPSTEHLSQGTQLRLLSAVHPTQGTQHRVPISGHPAQVPISGHPAQGTQLRLPSTEHPAQPLADGCWQTHTLEEGRKGGRGEGRQAHSVVWGKGGRKTRGDRTVGQESGGPRRRSESWTPCPAV